MHYILKVILFIFLFCVVFIVWLNVYIFSITQSLIVPIEDIPERYKIALLFGAGVSWNQLSLMLQDRASTVVELFSNEIVDKVLISADNSREEYDEVRPTRDFLIEKGIKSWVVYLDFAGFDSYDSLYRAKEIFGADQLILVSQEFHLPRLLFLCRGLWLDCIGLKADKHDYLGLWYNYFREFGANVKAYFSLLLNVEPKFLWEKIPLTGESNAFRYDEI